MVETTFLCNDMETPGLQYAKSPGKRERVAGDKSQWAWLSPRLRDSTPIKKGKKGANKVMKAKITSLSRAAAASILTGLLCCLPVSKPQAQIIIFGGGFGGSSSTSASTSFQGNAVAVTGFAAGSAVSVANSGALAAAGGAQEAAVLETSVASGLTVGAAHSAVIGGGAEASAEASVANVNLVIASAFFGGSTTIMADFVMSHAGAACVAGMATVSGSVVGVTGLLINGQAVAVTGAANQFVFLSDGGYVIINEQSAGFGVVTVNALHVIDMFAGVNVVFGSATIGITCASATTTESTGPAMCDFVTGGGWITGTPSGAKANFGVAGGIKNGAFWGHLNYIDHGNGMHVKQTAVTGYAFDPNDPDCRIIDYNVTIDGQAGTARVRVCDKGEPGRNDIFEIQLSNGYFAGGDLGGSHPGGGNIQLHKCHE